MDADARPGGPDEAASGEQGREDRRAPEPDPTQDHFAYAGSDDLAYAGADDFAYAGADDPDPDEEGGVGQHGEIHPGPQDVRYLIWKDAAGVVVVGLDVGGSVVAVPAVPVAEPLTPADFLAQLAAGVVTFPVRDRRFLAGAPRVPDLLGLQSWSGIAEQVGRYYGLRLAGPPPGPPTTPLPPWWVPPPSGRPATPPARPDRPDGPGDPGGQGRPGHGQAGPVAG